MAKYIISIVILAIAANCLGDTFTERSTGRTFNGYIVNIQRGNKTQVRIDGSQAEYIDLGAFEVKYNHLGRKNNVHIFSLKDPLDLVVEADTFEEAIQSAANQGPLFILIDIDCPGGRPEVAQRFASTITRVNNCQTVAYIGDGQYAGVYSNAALIALACDKVYIREGASISGTEILSPSSASQASPAAYQVPSQYRAPATQIPTAPQPPSAHDLWSPLLDLIIQQNQRPPLLVNALINKDVEIVEVVENNVYSLIDARNKKPTQTIVRTIGGKDTVLTLTAADAAKYGMADRVVTSREDLLAAFDASKARLIPDNKVLRAKRELDRVRTTLETMLDSISATEGRAAALNNQINAVEADINRMNQVASFDRENIPRGYYRSSREEIAFRDQTELHANLTRQLVATLNQLLRDYRRAFDIAEPYPDLGQYTQAIAKNFESARRLYETKYTEVTFPRVRFDDDRRIYRMY